MQYILFLARSNFLWNSALVDVGGLVLGISNTLVIPPATAALLPECKSSVSVEPGSLKWVCVSMHPGKTVCPSAFIISFASSDISPILWIFPSLTAIFTSFNCPSM